MGNMNKSGVGGMIVGADRSYSWSVMNMPRFLPWLFANVIGFQREIRHAELRFNTYGRHEKMVEIYDVEARGNVMIARDPSQSRGDLSLLLRAMLPMGFLLRRVAKASWRDDAVFQGELEGRTVDLLQIDREHYLVHHRTPIISVGKEKVFVDEVVEVMELLGQEKASLAAADEPKQLTS